MRNALVRLLAGLSVILYATAALAVGAAAHQLPRLVFRRQEGVPAKAASPFAHTGGLATTVIGGGNTTGVGGTGAVKATIPWIKSVAPVVAPGAAPVHRV